MAAVIRELKRLSCFPISPMSDRSKRQRACNGFLLPSSTEGADTTSGQLNTLYTKVDPSSWLLFHATWILSGDESFYDVDQLIRFENVQNDQLWVISIHIL